MQTREDGITEQQELDTNVGVMYNAEIGQYMVSVQVGDVMTLLPMDAAAQLGHQLITCATAASIFPCAKQVYEKVTLDVAQEVMPPEQFIQVVGMVMGKLQ